MSGQPAFGAFWPSAKFVQQAVAQLPVFCNLAASMTDVINAKPPISPQTEHTLQGCAA